MKKFKEVKSVAAYIDRQNIDTDAIIPKQYLKSVTREGFGETLFDDWRYLEPGNLGDNHSLRKKNPEFFLNKQAEGPLIPSLDLHPSLDLEVFARLRNVR